MPQSRNSQISLVDTPYYHCTSRCVRRAYLCGHDSVTGNSYEHRRQWVEDKLLFLGQVFAIDVCAYAVMNNHTHIVLHVDQCTTQHWDTFEILTRWHKLFKGTLLTQKYLKNAELSKVELKAIDEIAQVYRSRLMNISWFMRILNERIAREANKEDECTGRFWEGRFKSQALLDEAALITCMAYVDLNPVRAAIATTPENSNFTSIKLRVHYALRGKPCPKLLVFQDSKESHQSNHIPFNFNDYLELVDLTGRCLSANKRGFINKKLPKILERLNISEKNWLVMAKEFTTVFHGPVGSETVISNFTANKCKKRRSNLANIQKLFA